MKRKIFVRIDGVKQTCTDCGEFYYKRKDKTYCKCGSKKIPNFVFSIAEEILKEFPKSIPSISNEIGHTANSFNKECKHKFVIEEFGCKHNHCFYCNACQSINDCTGSGFIKQKKDVLASPYYRKHSNSKFAKKLKSEIKGYGYDDIYDDMIVKKEMRKAEVSDMVKFIKNEGWKESIYGDSYHHKITINESHSYWSYHPEKIIEMLYKKSWKAYKKREGLK